MNFNLDTFIKPLADSDRNIQIYNVSGIIQHTINPFSVTRLNISNNLIKINLKYNKVITLDFRTVNEAKAALVKLQIQLDTLRNKVPTSIDKQIQNYVDNKDTTTSSTASSYPLSSKNILVENIWVESNLIPTDINDALSSTIVASMSGTMSWVTNSYSFVISPTQSTRVVPDNYGSFYHPLLFSSINNSPISATGMPYWKITDDVVTFYGGFPPNVGPTSPPIIKYFKYTGRLGTFNLIGGKTNIIETTGTSNVIPLSSNIRMDNIISVTVNGILIYRWDYNILNEIVIDELSLGYQIEPSDLIRIETNTEPGGSFSVI